MSLPRGEQFCDHADWQEAEAQEAEAQGGTPDTEWRWWLIAVLLGGVLIGMEEFIAVGCWAVFLPLCRWAWIMTDKGA